MLPNAPKGWTVEALVNDCWIFVSSYLSLEGAQSLLKNLRNPCGNLCTGTMPEGARMVPTTTPKGGVNTMPTFGFSDCKEVVKP